MTDLNDKTILLTGGTGSFGTAFCRYAITNFPHSTLRVFSRDEVKQSELRSQFGDEQIRYLIGDVRDRQRLFRAAQGADFIIHAAAMKQVPACEYNPFEAVNINVLGAQNVVDAAIDAGVRRVVSLSTDKAVNPVNLYGATKLCAEKIVVHGNSYAGATDLALSCVRYGNVMGSRGSVVPLFRRQAEEGSITITDKEMTRFWITLDQSIDLVMTALSEARRGEVLVPKIPSMRVVDLAEAIAPGLPHKVIGIRPGEKLHEVLITSDESRRAIDAGRYYVIVPDHPWRDHAERIEEFQPVPKGFEYRSDSNSEFLSADELRLLLR